METNAKTLRNTVIALCRIAMYESLLLWKSFGKHLRIRSRRCTYVRLMSKKNAQHMCLPISTVASALLAGLWQRMRVWWIRASGFRIATIKDNRMSVCPSYSYTYGLSVLFRSSGSVSSLKESIYYRSLATHTTTITYPKCDFSFTSTALLLHV